MFHHRRPQQVMLGKVTWQVDHIKTWMALPHMVGTCAYAWMMDYGDFLGDPKQGFWICGLRFDCLILLNKRLFRQLFKRALWRTSFSVRLLRFVLCFVVKTLWHGAVFLFYLDMCIYIYIYIYILYKETENERHTWTHTSPLRLCRSCLRRFGGFRKMTLLDVSTRILSI